MYTAVVKTPPSNLWIMAVLVPVFLLMVVIGMVSFILCKRNRVIFKTGAFRTFKTRSKVRSCYLTYFLHLFCFCIFPFTHFFFTSYFLLISSNSLSCPICSTIPTFKILEVEFSLKCQQDYLTAGKHLCQASPSGQNN